jgi:competence protein ComEC
MSYFWGQLLAQRERWILWIPVAIAAGVGSYFSLHIEPPVWLGLSLTGLLLSAASFFYRNKTALLVWLPFFLIALGFTAAQLRTWYVTAPMLERKTYPLILEGQVSTVEALPESHRIILDHIRYQDEYGTPLPENMPERVRVKLKRNDTPPHEGDQVRLKAILLPLSPPVLPGAYDFQRHIFFLGIGSTGFAISNVEVTKQGAQGFFFESLRRYIHTHIADAMESKDAAAITTALLDGEDQDISKDTYEFLRKAGIAHLIAISGLQITLVTGFLFFAVRALLASIPYIALRYPIKKITAFIAMLGAIFYMLLIGSSISAERSVIMVCVVMLAIMIDRDPFTLRLAAFSAAAILLFQPESLVGASFQLSFAAVIALIAFYESTRNWWSGDYKQRGLLSRFGLYIAASMATTFIATLATAALSLFHFLRTPLFAGLVANLIAVPLSSFVTMPAAIIGCFLMPLGLEKIPLKIAEGSVIAIIKVANIVSQWPYAVYHADAWPMWILVMMVLGGLWICLWLGKIRWLGLVPVLAGIILIPLQPRADVLISEDGKLFAVRDQGGILRLSEKRAQKFAQQIWIEREAEPGADYWPEENGPQEGSFISCDSSACIYRSKGHVVSFIRDQLALQQDCGEADIIISALYIDRIPCVGPKLVIGKADLRQKGAHTLYFERGGDIRVRTVFGERGIRPWTMQPADFNRKSPIIHN